jgi:dsDNA-specific endonuclease/ATPase MutS2
MKGEDRGEGEPPESEADQGATPLEIDGVLDLHMFAPREAAALTRDYIDECARRGILDVRIIHGKGIGHLRRIVHAVLASHPAVVSFGHPSDPGSWGATVARLRGPQ